MRFWRPLKMQTFDFSNLKQFLNIFRILRGKNIDWAVQDSQFPKNTIFKKSCSLFLQSILTRKSCSIFFQSSELVSQIGDCPADDTLLARVLALQIGQRHFCGVLVRLEHRSQRCYLLPFCRQQSLQFYYLLLQVCLVIRFVSITRCWEINKKKKTKIINK